MIRILLSGLVSALIFLGPANAHAGRHLFRKSARAAWRLRHNGIVLGGDTA